MRLRAIATWSVGWLPWLGPALVLVALGYRQRWVTEDAFITFRVVGNLLAGDGPVYNVGERVEAYTHPLWLAMLAALQAFGVDLARGTPVLGIALSVTGLLAAQAASALLARRLHGDDRPSPLVPLGAMVFVALRVVWDFTTSGLETGLTFAWIGGSYALVARAALGDAAPATRRRAIGIAAFVVGLGPLVRPDLAVMSAPFLVTLCALPGTRGRRRLLEIASIAALALAVPVAYQVFRMGYFAAIVPNTALAKEAGEAYWRQGFLYVKDFVRTYWLWIPGSLLLVWAVRAARPAMRAPGIVRLLLVAPLVGAALHAVWVARVGGDFMHGRFLLPSLFAALAPLAMVRAPARRRSLDALVIAVVFTWAVACGLSRAWTPAPQPEATGIVDERRFYVEPSGRPRDIVARWTEDGRSLRRQAAADARTLTWNEHTVPLARAGDPRIAVVTPNGNIGFLGYAAGPRVHVVDRVGLADPIASRLRLMARERPGHEKRLPLAWVVARFTEVEDAPGVRGEEVRAARAALRCGRLAELLDAITAPLTLDRFRRNILASWALTRLRLPGDPERARDQLCQGG